MSELLQQAMWICMDHQDVDSKGNPNDWMRVALLIEKVAQQAPQQIPEGYVLVPKTALDGALYLAGLAVTSTDFGSQYRADFKVCCGALLSGSKENNNE
jgi:hypothetical protein